MRKPHAPTSRRPRAAPLALGAFLFLGAAAPAQSNANLKAIADEQGMLRKRMEGLRQKMDLLGRRLESEGRTHAAELLRRGLERLAKASGPAGEPKTIENRMAEIAESLAHELPAQVLDDQEQLVRDLEELLSILLDRQDLERLEKALAEYQEDVAALERLRSEEAKLRDETRALGERGASPAEQETAAALEELAREMRSVDAAARDGRERLGRLERAAGELEALVASQEQLLPPIEGLSKHEPDASLSDLLERARVLAEAFARARAFAEAKEAAAGAASRATRAAERAASGEIPPSEAAREREEAAAQARSAAQAAREGGSARSREIAAALEKLASTLAALRPGGSKEDVENALKDFEARASEAAKQAQSAASGFEQEAGATGSDRGSPKGPAERAAQAAKRAGEALGNGDATAAAEAAEEAARDLERAAATTGSPASLAREEREIAARAEQAAKGLEGASASETSKGAADQARGASSSLGRAAKALESGDASQAAPPAEEALERLRRARDAAKEALEEERKLLPSREEPLAQREEALAGRARSLADAIRAREALSPRQKEGASRATGEAAESMEEGGRATRQGEGSRASASRAAALDALARARRALSEARSVGETAPEEAKALARRQQEIRERILELARRLREKPNRPRPRSLDSAGSSAGEAGEALDRGDLGEAEPREEETEKYLAQAREEVERERNRYLRLREEELLFKIGDELAAMIRAHEEARAKTAGLEAERREAGEPTRAMKIALRKTAESEKQIAEDCARLGKGLEAEEAKVFSFLLASNEEDLRVIAESMGPPDFATDDRVRGLQEDVAARFTKLRDALKDEIRRRGQPNDRETNQGPQQNRLVPDLAELKMLKILEEEFLERTQAFGRRLEILEAEDDPFARGELERLAHRHNRITELFQEFMTRLGHRSEATEDADGKGDEGHPPDGPPRRTP